MDRHLKGLATVAALVFGALTAGGYVPLGDSQGQAPTPMDLFQKMVPVIRHDRCTNCHGGVDPASGRNHKEGPKAPDECDGCHMDGWETPIPDHFFPPKNDRELCGQFSEIASKMGHEFFVTKHLRGDTLIKVAFNGDAAGQIDPPKKPPQSQDDFIKLAEDWLSRGQGACDVEGTITLVETVHSEDSWHMAPHTDDLVVQDGSRRVTVTLSGGRYRANIVIEGSIVGTHVTHSTDAQGRPCTVTLNTTSRYTGSGSGPASVVAKDTVYFNDTDPKLGQRDYRIDVGLPEEHTRKTESGHIQDGCGTRLPQPDPDDQTFDWPGVSFVLEGHLDDPKLTNLVGSCDRRVKHGDVGELKGIAEMSCNRFGNMGNSETPGLMDRGANIAFHDGSDVVFRAQSWWNIRFRR